MSRKEQDNYRQRGWNDMSGKWKLVYSLSSTAWRLRLPSGKIFQRSSIYGELEREDPLTIRFTRNHRIYMSQDKLHIPLGALIAMTT